MNHDKPVHVGQNVYISTTRGCDEHHRDFRYVVHIRRDDVPNVHCEHSKALVETRGPIGLFKSVSLCQEDMKEYHDCFIEYRHGDPLSFSILLEVAGFAPDPGDKLLIHSAAGRTRSPTVAIVAKIVRGCRLREGLGDVVCSLWTARRVSANICPDPLRDILGWAETRKIGF
jgi:hypothetical protein